jgi:uncharacterized protein (UPF0332 family)
MPELLNKSQLNFESAKLLVDEGFYAPSVHCSYYASFQLLKNVVCFSEGIGYNDLKTELNEINSDSRKKHIGVHEFLIDLKLGDLIERENLEYDVLKHIKDLKVARARADYENSRISLSESEKALKKSAFIIKCLEKVRRYGN